MARFNEKEKERNVTVFGEKTKFNGVLRFSEELHIEGSFTGTIDAQGALVLKKGSTCSADYVRAASIVVEGTVQGDLTAGDRIEMRTGSTVRGNITASRLRIADGVSFEGSVEMIRSGGDVDLFATRADTLKNQIRIDQNA
ncbi:MAG TPA: polymer-forming cytoskeletal protein [Treponemataceae bacterium]|nr:polymer-forming cytoskeletal protein [Treponemataceae bacterium]HPS45151.1 polymer-forming cytoskeletal protein [Treponemataceae bacterium]